MASYHYDQDGNYIGKTITSIDKILKALGIIALVAVACFWLCAYYVKINEILAPKGWTLEEILGLAFILIVLITACTAIVGSVVLIVKKIRFGKTYRLRSWPKFIRVLMYIGYLSIAFLIFITILTLSLESKTA